jgi:cyclic beta-1,2-glucan synthetase
MGWERKRGKLHELNRLLRGASDTSFVRIVGTIPHAVRYVITLNRFCPGNMTSSSCL